MFYFPSLQLWEVLNAWDPWPFIFPLSSITFLEIANLHFWIGTLGIIFYALPMYVAGFQQWAMWKQFNPDGTLVYGNFLETVTEIMPMYWMRAIGGTLYITGMLILVVNIIITIRNGSKVTDELAEAAALKRVSKRRVAGEGWHTWSLIILAHAKCH